MKRKLQGVFVGGLIGAIITSGVGMAEQMSRTAELIYNDIKIYIDGKEIVPKDAEGNIVEPFIINGTTYLPARAISHALGKDVEWDEANQSVYIGKKDQTKPDNYLHNLDYNDYKQGHSWSEFAIINGTDTVTDYNQKVYKNGLVFMKPNYFSEIANDIDESHFLISYPLNSQYKKLVGNIVLPKEYDIKTIGKSDCKSYPVDVLFYGDGKLLDKKINVTSSDVGKIDLDIKGVDQLTIKIRITRAGDSTIALTDLALYK